MGCQVRQGRCQPAFAAAGADQLSIVAQQEQPAVKTGQVILVQQGGGIARAGYLVREQLEDGGAVLDLVRQAVGGGTHRAQVALAHQRTHRLVVQGLAAKGDHQQQHHQRQDNKQEHLQGKAAPAQKGQRDAALGGFLGCSGAGWVGFGRVLSGRCFFDHFIQEG